MYFYIIKKKLILYLLIGVIVSALIGLTTIVIYETELLSEYRTMLQVIAGKREYMLKEIERIRGNIQKASVMVPVNTSAEEAILQRVDQIRLMPGLSMGLHGFVREDDTVKMPVTITYRTEEFLNLLKVLQRLRFNSYPLFYYESIIVEASPSRDSLQCTIKGYLLTPLLQGGLSSGG